MTLINFSLESDSHHYLKGEAQEKYSDRKLRRADAEAAAILFKCREHNLLKKFFVYQIWFGATPKNTCSHLKFNYKAG